MTLHDARIRETNLWVYDCSSSFVDKIQKLCWSDALFHEVVVRLFQVLNR